MYNHNFTSHISIFSSHDHCKQKVSIKMLFLLLSIFWCLCDLLKYNTIGNNVSYVTNVNYTTTFMIEYLNQNKSWLAYNKIPFPQQSIIIFEKSCSWVSYFDVRTRGILAS